MSRLKPLETAQMDAAQKALHDAMMKVWKRAHGGPFDLWYQSPDLGQRSNALGAYCRFESKLEFDVLETTILTVAAYWDQEYEWVTHAKNALAAGLDQHVIDAIKAGETPIFETVEQSLAHDLTREILETRKLSQSTYERAVAIFGETALTDLSAIVGWYSCLAIQMNVFDIGA